VFLDSPSDGRPDDFGNRFITRFPHPIQTAEMSQELSNRLVADAGDLLQF
jgi:hypothetical protein